MTEYVSSEVRFIFSIGLVNEHNAKRRLVALQMYAKQERQGVLVLTRDCHVNSPCFPFSHFSLSIYHFKA